MNEDEKIIQMPIGAEEEPEAPEVEPEADAEEEEKPVRKGGTIFLMRTIHGAIKHAVNEFDIGPMSILGVLEAVKHDICIAVAKGAEEARKENEAELTEEEQDE